MICAEFLEADYVGVHGMIGAEFLEVRAMSFGFLEVCGMNGAAFLEGLAMRFGFMEAFGMACAEAQG